MARQWSTTWSLTAAVAGRLVHGERPVVEGVGGEEGHDLLGELVRPVVVRAVGDGCRQAVRLGVGAHGVVGAGLRRVVRGAGAVGVFLGEGVVGVERQVAVDLAGRDVVKARHAGVPGGLEHRLRAEHVGTEEQTGVEHGQAVVGLGGEVDHRVDGVLAQPGRGKLAVANVTLDEDDAVLDVGQVGPVSGVGEGVVGDDAVAGVVLRPSSGRSWNR